MKGGVDAHWPKDGSLPPHVQEFVNWLVTPEWERPEGQKTQAEWARANDVRREMTTVWKADARVKRAISQRCDEVNLDPATIQEVIAAVHRAAMRGDMKAAQLYLQHADKLKPRRIIIEDASVAGLTDEQLKEKLVATGLFDDD